ncbi:MAG TPA: hypothetical protein VLS27_08495 [Gammaproteobacteria bacterium]|nr:hypothetical protein [Gammaproteobacteria bacterium]
MASTEGGQMKPDYKDRFIFAGAVGSGGRGPYQSHFAIRVERNGEREIEYESVPTGSFPTQGEAIAAANAAAHAWIDEKEASQNA